MLWLALLVFAATVSAIVITSNWERYSANPSVVSLEKDFREWEFEFPSVTICYHDKVNESKAQEYIWKLVLLCRYSYIFQSCDTLKEIKVY
jgi:hypothetical protein